MKESILDLLFESTGIVGLFSDDFEQAKERCKPQETDKEALVKEAKELGVQNAHLFGIDKLKEKIAEAKKG